MVRSEVCGDLGGQRSVVTSEGVAAPEDTYIEASRSSKDTHIDASRRPQLM